MDKACQSLGYDIKQRKYTGTWIDSTMSYRWELSGTVDEKSLELTITTSGPGSHRRHVHVSRALPIRIEGFDHDYWRDAER
jgi:uncharacterized protein DUF1579